MEILLSLIGLLVGAIATWFFCNRKTNMIIRQRETLSISLAARTKEVELIREQMEKEARESADHLDEQNREAEIRLKELRQQADQRLQEVKEQADGAWRNSASWWKVRCSSKSRPCAKG